jgi:hypothetical protein
MTMMPFHVLFPEEAKNECRTITPTNHGRLPSRTFLFMELYCVEQRCDCRRVILNVMDTEARKQVATINHGFEPPKPPFDDEGQTFLDPLNPQSSMAEALLDLFEEMLANDVGYQARLERHYAMWKRVVDDPAHPDHARVKNKLHGAPDFEPAFRRQEPARREGPKIGPNALCPCGSGKKFKKCCRD